MQISEMLCMCMHGSGISSLAKILGGACMESKLWPCLQYKITATKIVSKGLTKHSNKNRKQRSIKKIASIGLKNSEIL